MAPPRRRRSGYCPGELSEHLREAIAAETALVGDIEGSVARIDAVSETIAAVDEALVELGALRWNALLELRAQSFSFDQIAAVASLSTTRLRQLAAEARELGADARGAQERDPG